MLTLIFVARRKYTQLGNSSFSLLVQVLSRERTLCICNTISQSWETLLFSQAQEWLGNCVFLHPLYTRDTSCFCNVTAIWGSIENTARQVVSSHYLKTENFSLLRRWESKKWISLKIVMTEQVFFHRKCYRLFRNRMYWNAKYMATLTPFSLCAFFTIQ